MDVNGDGLPDLIGISNNQVYVQLNTGGGAFAAATSSTTLFDTSVGWFTTSLQPHVWPADVSGSGMTGFLGISNNSVSVQTLTGPAGFAPWARVTNVVDGLGATTQITYKPLTDNTVYTKDPSFGTYPTLNIQSPIYVVSSVSGSNAVGGTLTSTYKYGGLKFDLSGRGMLGFRWMDATQPTNPPDSVTTHAEFHQDWPFTGMLSLTQKKVTSGGGSGGVVNSITNTYSCTSPSNGSSCAAAATTCTVAAGNRYFPYASQSVSSGYDLNATINPTVTTTTGYDTCGNVRSVVVSTPDGYQKTTTNTYPNSPDTVNWFLGQLQRSAVTSVTP
jgi:hypothetical protein